MQSDVKIQQRVFCGLKFVMQYFNLGAHFRSVSIDRIIWVAWSIPDLQICFKCDTFTKHNKNK